MHTEPDLPEFLRDGWLFAEDEQPAIGRPVQVRIEDGAVAMAVYCGEESGRQLWRQWIFEELESTAVKAWRGPIVQVYKFAWEMPPRLLAAPVEIGRESSIPFSSEGMSFSEGEALWISTGNGDEYAAQRAGHYLGEFLRTSVERADSPSRPE